MQKKEKKLESKENNKKQTAIWSNPMVKDYNRSSEVEGQKENNEEAQVTQQEDTYYKRSALDVPAHMKASVTLSGKQSIRKEAKVYIKEAKAYYDDFKNRGQGDSRVQSMMYASWRLGKVCKRILRREVTPEVVYDFHFAKHLFETAQHMKMTSYLELPKQYILELETLRRREEEEDYDWYSLEDEDEEQ